MKIKKCPICKIGHPLNMFNKNKARKDGLNYHCKSCEKKKMRKWLENNRDYCKEKASLWYVKNKERARQYRIKNKEKIAKRMVGWRRRKQQHIKQYKSKYNKEVQSKNINYKLIHNLRTRLRLAVKGNKKWAKTMELVGCDVATLKSHLESKFAAGMSWENYGRKGWHIDHILPCDSFDLTVKENQIKCFHYTNLQPLWWIDNCRKGNRVVYS